MPCACSANKPGASPGEYQPLYWFAGGIVAVGLLTFVISRWG